MRSSFDTSSPAAAALLRPALPAALRRGLWAWPLLLSLLFVSGVVLWAYRTSQAEREESHHTMISDALSAEAQLRARLDLEAVHLRALAAQLRRMPRNRQALAANPEVEAGLRGLWLSVTWLDVDNRIVAHLPAQSVPPFDLKRATREDERDGLSAHLVAPVDPALAEAVPDTNRFDVAGEKVVVRFSPTALLKRDTPWWLTRRYEVQLVDGSDQVIASADGLVRAPAAAGLRDSYRVLVGGGLPGVYLQLTEREAPPPWWQGVPLVLVGGFLLLIGGATLLLRRQMRQVSAAEAAWRTEVAWRGAMEDSALVGLRARDADGRLLYVNRTFCEMVGRPAEELLGLKPPMPYWPPESAGEAMQRSRRGLAGLAPREGYEAEWRHADGHRIEVMVFESPLVDARGQQIGWMGSIIDITTRKRLEERERHQAEALAHQARLTTLGEVASALAHQLNQPLTAVAGYNAGVLRRLEQAGCDDAMVMQALRRQGEQAAEAGRIVRRIREFLTRRAPQREPAVLREIVQQAVGLLQRDFQRQQVRVSLDLPATLPKVQADPVLIEQVLINLLRNAADELVQRPPGLARQIIVSGTETAGGFVRLDVDDNGPGLAGRTAEQLTTPFYSTKPEGMGMGLAICRSVIEVHHGAFDAGVSPLGGARFSCSLPVWQDTAGAADTGEPDDTPDGAPGRR
ncbi:PAS domain S-box protein [Ideonella sp. B7]|uniref:sensor histidine kinase n=1 Tax=Ideonella benzenivorans TaxID=2831643 RepID=UPI001CEDFB96|nr:PAS domain S-box protein [Ideonella benzenivorans]MCA6218388.1 PAS domain S-box protein [Ideonella benzenivorans]